jgi:hypothetical protein
LREHLNGVKNGCRFQSLSQTFRWNILVTAAKRAIEAQGYKMTREPGRGLSNMWRLEKDGQVKLGAIRTTQDRWFAFPPLNGGAKWKTLDEVDLVILAAVDVVEEPKNVEVYLFPASEVRKRFDAAYQARSKNGHIQQDNFGMWIALDTDKRGIAASVGSGINVPYPSTVVYTVDELAVADTNNGTPAEVEGVDDEPELQQFHPTTIAEVLRWAKERVAEIAGVRVDAVRLELKLES